MASLKLWSTFLEAETAAQRLLFARVGAGAGAGAAAEVFALFLAWVSAAGAALLDAALGGIMFVGTFGLGYGMVTESRQWRFCSFCFLSQSKSLLFHDTSARFRHTSDSAF